MKVLVVGDFTSQPCGIRNFADQTYAALSRHPGLQVAKWDGHYPELYRRREAQEATYLPADAHTYDVIHVNWHPIAFNTYGPGHFPAPAIYAEVPTPGPFRVGAPITLPTFTPLRVTLRKPILSVYLNDIPPWSGCPFHDQADVRFAAEPSEGCIELPYPCADWIQLPQADQGFSVGCSTVRGDGVKVVEKVCAKEGWDFRTPDHSKGWRTYEEEVQRIARNTVNVLWYFEGRGKSGGLSQAISARRPVICSGSPMFSHFWDYRGDIYFSDDLEEALQEVYEDWENNTLTRPTRAAEARSWTRATQRMVEAWEEARRR